MRLNHIRIEQFGKVQIPVVDLSPVLKGDAEATRTLAKSVASVCRDFGFLYVENHGIDSEFLDKAQHIIEKFFQLSDEEKLQIHISKSAYHRGYFPNGEENALGSPVKDIKEAFDMALELSPDDPCVVAGKPFHGPNAWPDALPEFKTIMLELYEKWRLMCSRISKVFALALELPEDYFVDKTNKPMAQMRAAFYPNQRPTEVKDAVGCGAHTDYGIVSAIWQIDVPGLQIETLAGEWIDAPRIPGTFVCPLGDMIEHWTNGFWKATNHRVINISGEARHSAAFFFDPNYDCIIAPLSQFVSDKTPAAYEPITMGEHVRRGFDGTFNYRTTQPHGA